MQPEFNTTRNEVGTPHGAPPSITDQSSLAGLALPPLASRAPTIDIAAIVDIRELLKRDYARSIALIDQGFEIYCDCFQDPSERSSKETLIEFSKNPAHNWRMYLALDAEGNVIGGRHLAIMTTTINGAPVPFAWGEHLYVHTDPQYRRHGLGSQIVEETNNLLPLVGVGLVFSEQNDPHLMTEGEMAEDTKSGITPLDRLTFWQKLGYRTINAPYAQPSLEDDRNPVWYLQPCFKVVEPAIIPKAVSITDSSIGREAYLALIRCFHSTFVNNIEEDPTSKYLHRLIASGPETLSVIDLKAPRTFHQERIDLAE